MIAGFGEVAETLRRSTVQVEAGRQGQGSGVLWNSEGLIVTNAHVARAEPLHVVLWDGRRYPAAIAARDDGRDLAALTVSATRLPGASIGDSSRLRPGELVVAVGNPLGFIGALTTGVVHAVGPVAGLSRRPWVQADVRLAPGNSGGPLADASGRVIGINSMVAGRLGLAVPSNAVREFLIRRGSTPKIGVGIRPVTVRFKQREGPGLAVVEVTPGSPAAAASLMIGDILVGVGGRLFETWDDLSASLENAQPPLAVEFLRGDRKTIRHATLQWAIEPEGVAKAA
ncbi:MAG: trypsin-like peptidase domain-containing protein [Bryobacteraceae bacterium]|nr:trypsin-like peptidase domain-containing protein [Bryobacteraceae bacterium]